MINKNKKLIYIISLTFFIVGNIIWIFIPLLMALLWSVVDPDHTWSFPDLFPKVLSFARWSGMWEQTPLAEAMMHSYTIASIVSVISIILAIPTAYAFGRIKFKGKAIAEMLTLIPLVIPGMVIAIFFSAVIMNLNIDNPFISIAIGHTVLTLPYSIRILSAGFKAVPQELIDASRDLGANMWATFCNAFLPLLKPSILASLIFCFMRSLEEFSLAFVIGSPDFITVPTVLYHYLGYQFVRPNAAVLSMIIIIPNVILMFIIERLLKGNYLSQSTGKG